MAKVRSWVGLDVHAAQVVACVVDGESGEMTVHRLSGETAEVVAGKAFDFSATVSGTDDSEVIWTVQEGEAGGRVVTRAAKAKGGTGSSLAVYIAPTTPGTYHLLATSEADPLQSASAEATVTKR